ASPYLPSFPTRRSSDLPRSDSPRMSVPGASLGYGCARSRSSLPTSHGSTNSLDRNAESPGYTAPTPPWRKLVNAMVSNTIGRKRSEEHTSELQSLRHLV